MPKFIVEITEGNSGKVVIEAENAAVAEDAVRSQYEAGIIVMDDFRSGWVDFEVHAAPLIITDPNRKPA